MESLQITPLEEQYLKDVVRIHRHVLGYTFNSRLGPDHLAFLYRAMAQAEDSYVGVALIDDQPVGVVSGTLDMDKIKMSMLSSFKLRQWGYLLLRLLGQPSLIHEWWKGNIIGRSVYFERKLIQPILTAIAVDSGYQGQGVGKCLVHDLERFFTRKNIVYYRLDTLIENSSARKFYEHLGFQQVEMRADSIVFVKKISDE
jgi:ribosomal protein S18 acetylase RimI-like enzyme